MIPLRELRIGNVVQKDGKLHVIQENDFLQGNNFEPVQINADELTLLGFNKQGFTSIFFRKSISEKNNWFYLSSPNSIFNELHGSWSHKAGEYSLAIAVVSVSQLQNLYFFTTGTELDISSLLKERQ